MTVMLKEEIKGQQETDKEEHSGQQFLRGQEWLTSGVRRGSNKKKNESLSRSCDAGPWRSLMNWSG